MTPKEKAEKLCNKMFIGSAFDYTEKEEFHKAKTQAKRCALIAVDEIINFLYDDMVSHNTYQYWIDVKNEIELL